MIEVTVWNHSQEIPIIDVSFDTEHEAETFALAARKIVNVHSILIGYWGVDENRWQATKE